MKFKSSIAFTLLLAVSRVVGFAEPDRASRDDFRVPIRSQVPILYNDHHVYAAPNLLRQGRLLAAITKGGTLLIPLRSMFEQMGATVSFDPSTRAVAVSKPGAQVSMAVGKAEVVINGESRPIDVPPIVFRGTVIVPLRVISESMGAYVQWVPDRHIVVVRYIPATPPPTLAPPPPPPPTPLPSPGKVFQSTLQLFNAQHPEWGLKSGTYFGRYSYVLLFRSADDRNRALLTSLFAQYVGHGETVVLGTPQDTSDTIHYNVFEIPVRSGAYSAINGQASTDDAVKDVESEYDWNEALSIRRRYCDVAAHASESNPICGQPFDKGPVILTFFAPISTLRQADPALGYDFRIVIPDSSLFGSVIETIQLKIDDPDAVYSDRVLPPSAQVRIASVLDVLGAALENGRTGVLFWMSGLKASQAQSPKP